MTRYIFSSEWIKNLEDETRWMYYWYQQKIFFGRIEKNERILEVGVGKKITYNLLKQQGFDIKSADIDKEKDPDIEINIAIADDSFFNYDVVLAFNIFEHIPYDEFMSVMQKCYNNKIIKMFISFPRYGKLFADISINIPKIINKNFYITLPWGGIKTASHHWELEYSKYTKNKLISDMQGIGYACKDILEYKRQTYFWFDRIVKDS